VISDMNGRLIQAIEFGVEGVQNARASGDDVSVQIFRGKKKISLNLKIEGTY
jgi:hypothetical protein